MPLSPDDIIFFHTGPFDINATLVFTWAVMTFMSAIGWFATRGERGRLRQALETAIIIVEEQIEEIAPGRGRRLMPFIATLFLFIFTANVLAVVPGYRPPTGSLSTTVALAAIVFIAVPIFGVSESGLRGYLASYLRPNPFMLPFNLISELSRTVSLAVRLYGNVMSGVVLGAILLSIAPLFFPVLMQTLGLLTGVIQAYIFAVLATVYIAAATPSEPKKEDTVHG